jgi:tetratricopeptide (TPR) repeat protein
MGLDENHVLKMGLKMAEKGDFDGALKHFTSSMMVDPKNANFGKGLIYAKLGEYKNALDSFNHILDENNFPPAFYERAKVYRKMDRNEQALNSLDRALYLDPQNPLILLQKSDLLMEMGKLTDSLELIDNVISISPEISQAWHLKGDICSIQGITDGAYEAYSKALELNSNYLYSWVGSGLVFNDLKQYTDALECYESALEIDESYNYSNLFLALAYKSLEDYELALEYIETALGINKKFMDAWYEKGNILYLSGDFDGAMACFDKVSKNDPEFAYVEWKKGNILKERGDYKEAIKYFEKSLELDEEFVLSWESIAEVLYLSGKEEKANQCQNYIENNFLASDYEKVNNYLKNYYKNQYLNSRIWDDSEESFRYINDYFYDYFGKSSLNQLGLMHALDAERKKPYTPSFEIRKRLTAFGIFNLIIGFFAVLCGLIYGLVFYLIAAFTVIISYRVFTLSTAKSCQFNEMRNNFLYISGTLGFSLLLSILNLGFLFRQDPTSFFGLLSNHFHSRFSTHYYVSSTIPDPFYGFLMVIVLISLLAFAIYISAFPNYVFKHAIGTEPEINYNNYNMW